jgi:SSS family solute:Na+ symporter
MTARTLGARNEPRRREAPIKRARQNPGRLIEGAAAGSASQIDVYAGPPAMSHLSTPDWLIVAAYFVAIFVIALWPVAKAKPDKESEQYFLAGRNMGWFVIGASIFAANIGSDHVIGLAGSGAAGDMPAAQFEIIGSFTLLVLGWLFVPFYLKSGVFTMPEFLERRYSSGPRLYLAIVSVIGYVLTKISVTIAAGGIVFETLMGVNFWTGAIIIVVVTGVYTVIGGLRAVLYTDLLQTFLIIGGAIIVTVIGLEKLGGWHALKVSMAPEAFSLWRAASDVKFPWTGLIFGTTILGIWYWCTDQFIVQRTLSARSIDQAQKGTIFAALLKQLPLFIFVLPGLIAGALMKRGVIHYDRADQSLPAMIGGLLPTGLKGLVMAGLLASLMSSLSAVFNSCSTIVTMDLYRRIAPDASEHRLLQVGRIVTGLMVALSLAWIPFMGIISSGLYVYIQSVQSYISPPIAAVFLVGVLWSRANSKGAMAALAIGGIIGAVRLLLEMRKASLSGLMLDFVNINYLHFALLLFALAVLILVVVSHCTAPPNSEKVNDLILWNRAPLDFAHGQTRTNLALSVGVLAIVAAIWIYFS